MDNTKLTGAQTMAMDALAGALARGEWCRYGNAPEDDFRPVTADSLEKKGLVKLYRGPRTAKLTDLGVQWCKQKGLLRE